MPTETGRDLIESIRSQLGLEPEETNEPAEGFDAWLQEYEPEMFGEDEELEEGRNPTRDKLSSLALRSSFVATQAQALSKWAEEYMRKDPSLYAGKEAAIKKMLKAAQDAYKILEPALGELKRR